MAVARADTYSNRFSVYLSNYIDEFFTDCPVRNDMRKLKQRVHELLEGIQVKMDLPYTMLYTGSSTDGLLTKSDIDVMYCFKHFIVVEEAKQIPDDHENGVLLLDAEGCFPCYTRLQLYRPHPDPEMMKLFTSIDGKYYLVKEKYLEFLAPVFKQMIPGETHGPAFMVTGDNYSGRPDIDYVTCHLHRMPILAKSSS